MRIFTASSTKPQSVFSFYLIVFIILLLTSVSCADTPTDSLNKDSQKYLSFYDTEDGEKIHWEVNFDGDKITSIYKNGKRIPDDLADDYKHKIYDQLDEMRSGGRKFSLQIDDFRIDTENLQKEMEKFRKDLPKHKKFFEFHDFDDEKFKQDMEELKEKLHEHKLDEFNWKFDEEKFKEQLNELEKNLREHLPKPEDFYFHFDWEELNDGEV